MNAGLSLCGGSLRGAAHVGVLNRLEAHNIKINYLAGTSSGALVAGLYACGLSPTDMEHFANSLLVRKYFDFGLPHKALLKGDHIYQDLLRLTQGKHFCDLPIKLAIVCIDLVSGNLVVIKEGEVARAIRASIAIPGIFRPVEYNGKILVDGYILNNNPADIVRNMGADYVIAANITHLHYNYQPSNLFNSIQRYMSIASCSCTDKVVKKNADLIIDIDLRHFTARKSWKKLKTFPELVHIGEYYTEQKLRNPLWQAPSAISHLIAN